MIEGIDSLIRIPCKDIKNFFSYWVTFLRPFHHLTDREIDVLVGFLLQRYELSKVISDQNILDKVLMNEDTKRKIREECDMTLPYFQTILSKLRKNNIIVDNKINPKYIPNFKEENNSFKMILLFNLS